MGSETVKTAAFLKRPQEEYIMQNEKNNQVKTFNTNVNRSNFMFFIQI